MAKMSSLVEKHRKKVGLAPWHLVEARTTLTPRIGSVTRAKRDEREAIP